MKRRHERKKKVRPCPLFRDAQTLPFIRRGKPNPTSSARGALGLKIQLPAGEEEEEEENEDDEADERGSPAEWTPATGGALSRLLWVVGVELYERLHAR